MGKLDHNEAELPAELPESEMTPLPDSGVRIAQTTDQATSRHAPVRGNEIVVHPQQQLARLEAQAVAFLDEVDALPLPVKKARVQDLKTNNPQLFQAVQSQVAKRGKENLQTARGAIAASQESRKAADQVDAVIVDAQSQAAAVLKKLKKSA